mmetsp:Transcript_32463/g.28748  ORF Transcript_32463/g.28748 Transcript_32463/m.28748 type:complete len:143 (+) Transcript_32463:32-460(+)
MGNNCTCSDRDKNKYESVFKDYKPVEKRSQGQMFFDDVSFEINTAEGGKNIPSVRHNLNFIKESEESKQIKEIGNQKELQDMQNPGDNKGQIDKRKACHRVSAKQVLDYVLDDVRQKYKLKRKKNSVDMEKDAAWKMSPMNS